MGTFICGQPHVCGAFDDRLLAHLRAVMTAKLRRGESFLFTWTDDTRGHDVTQSLWMHPAVGMQFVFEGTQPQPLNRAWLEALAASANSASGLTTVPEPATTHAQGQRITRGVRRF